MFGNYLKQSLKVLSTIRVEPQLPSSLFGRIFQRHFANHRHKRMIKLSKGYFGRVNLYAVAKRRVEKARMYAYRDRRVRKREFRRLWIQRVGAASRMYGTSYNVFIHQLNRSGIQLDRKILADLAVTEPLSFRSVHEVVKSAAAANPPPAAVASASASS